MLRELRQWSPCGAGEGALYSWYSLKLRKDSWPSLWDGSISAPCLCPLTSLSVPCHGSQTLPCIYERSCMDTFLPLPNGGRPLLSVTVDAWARWFSLPVPQTQRTQDCFCFKWEKLWTCFHYHGGGISPILSCPHSFLWIPSGGLEKTLRFCSLTLGL